MAEKEENIATVSKRVQKKVRPEPVTPQPNPFPILEKSLVKKSPDVNVTVGGVAPKGKKELHVEE